MIKFKNKKALGILLSIVIILIFLTFYQSIHNATPVIYENACISIQGKTEIYNDRDFIKEIIDILNTTPKKRMLFPHQTLHSPTAIIAFNMKDGTDIYVNFYGEYVLYKNTEFENIQYKLLDTDKIYDKIYDYDF